MENKQEEKVLSEEELRKLRMSVIFGDIDTIIDADYEKLFEGTKILARTKKVKPKKKPMKKA